MYTREAGAAAVQTVRHIPSAWLTPQAGPSGLRWPDSVRHPDGTPIDSSPSRTCGPFGTRLRSTATQGAPRGCFSGECQRPQTRTRGTWRCDVSRAGLAGRIAGRLCGSKSRGTSSRTAVQRAGGAPIGWGGIDGCRLVEPPALQKELVEPGQESVHSSKFISQKVPP